MAMAGENSLASGSVSSSATSGASGASSRQARRPLAEGLLGAAGALGNSPAVCAFDTARSWSRHRDRWAACWSAPKVSIGGDACWRSMPRAGQSGSNFRRKNHSVGQARHEVWKRRRRSRGHVQRERSLSSEPRPVSELVSQLFQEQRGVAQRGDGEVIATDREALGQAPREARRARQPLRLREVALDRCRVACHKNHSKRETYSSEHTSHTAGRVLIA